MEKTWLTSYPPGVSSEIDTHEFQSLNELFERTCASYSDRPAFQSMGVKMSYRELDELSLRFASYLRSLPGLKRGARVAIMMPNLLQYPVAMYGTLRAGMVVVNVNPLYTPRELQHQLIDSGAEVIIVLENFAHVLQTALDGTSIRHVVTTEIADLLPQPRRFLINWVVRKVRKMIPVWRIDGAMPFRRMLDEARPDRDTVIADRNDIAFLQYTGGTTGLSKGAVLTHGNLVANLQQASAWMGSRFEYGREVAVTALPLYHVFALTANCLMMTKFGGCCLLIADPRNMKEFIRELEKTRFTVFTGVNTLFNGLMNSPGFADVDFSALKLTIGGGAAVQRVVAERWLSLTRVPIMEGYGLSETSPFAIANKAEEGYTGTIGLPLPSTEVSIRSEDGNPVPAGYDGEICIRGPQVMKGYWNRPEETAVALSRDGWFRTGDIGTMDKRGYVRITDRKKDMILVSGFNVYPTEVEAVAAACPGVFECAVVGVSDTKTGEAVKLFIVRSDPALDAAAVEAHCRSNLAAYKVPRHIEFRQALPKSPVGKILRRELRV
ncbi:MAG TPA: AMP-binding protein [Noviherbaspirillum sp.]|nr:AMP-binding protein [Noviherbaspirillum sp.]